MRKHSAFGGSCGAACVLEQCDIFGWSEVNVWFLGSGVFRQNILEPHIVTGIELVKEMAFFLLLG